MSHTPLRLLVLHRLLPLPLLLDLVGQLQFLLRDIVGALPCHLLLVRVDDLVQGKLLPPGHVLGAAVEEVRRSPRYARPPGGPGDGVETAPVATGRPVSRVPTWEEEGPGRRGR